MKKFSTMFFQAIVVLIGMSAFAFLIWEPTVEGRNVDATLFDIYFKDPFLACAYLVSISFFVALYKTFKVLGYARQDKMFSQATANALRTIKYCGSILASFVGAGVAYLFIVRPEDDIAGGVAMGLFIIFVSVVSATVAGVFERKVRQAITVKSDTI